MSNSLKIRTIVGGLGGVITLIYFFKDFVWNFITWWPSGWIFLIITILFYKRVRISWLRKKYGSKTGGKLIKFEGNKYYINQSNIIRWVKNKETLYELGYDFDEVKKLGTEEKSKYVEESPISIHFFK